MCVRLSQRAWRLVVVALGFLLASCHGQGASVTKDTTAERHPYAVLVRIAWHYDCAGAIISTEWVISSSQCYRENYAKSFAFAGQEQYGLQVELGANGQARELVRVYKHPEAYPPRRDILLGHANASWTFNAYVQYVPIYFEESVSRAKDCKAVGFGDTKSDMKMEDRPISNIKRCTVKKETSLLCTSNMNTVGAFDRGGPLVCSEKRLYGIMTNDTVGYFTLLSPYIDWMETFVDLPGRRRRKSGGCTLGGPSLLVLLLLHFGVILLPA